MPDTRLLYISRLSNLARRQAPLKQRINGIRNKILFHFCKHARIPVGFAERRKAMIFENIKKTANKRELAKEEKLLTIIFLKSYRLLS
jgi:hypothetical protein